MAEATQNTAVVNATPSSAQGNLEAIEKDFRRKSIWHSFKAGLYNTVGGAAAIAMSMGIISPIMAAVSVKGGMMLALSAAFPPATIGVLAAFAVVTVASLYLAQKETVEVTCIQNDRLAFKNALEVRGKAPEVQTPAEYPNQARSDGRSWQEAYKTTPIAERAV